MAVQMLHGLKTLHRMNIFHRDIKSANLLLTKHSEEVKLGDLNVSKISKSGLAVTQTGTPYYASP
jgi:NIMA (never in mitosis gene a)-related kinase